MPTYEYACRSCDAHLEIVQRFDDQPLSTCPSCGGALRKVVGSNGIAFKGSGFYKTDNRSSVKSDKGSSSDKGGSSEKVGSDSKGDSSTTAAKETSSSKSSSDTAASSTPAKSDSSAKSA